jgi:hypothetical protein
MQSAGGDLDRKIKLRREQKIEIDSFPPPIREVSCILRIAATRSEQVDSGRGCKELDLSESCYENDYLLQMTTRCTVDVVCSFDRCVGTAGD